MFNYKNKVCQDIAKDDDMYLGNKDHYLGVGESAIKNIIASLELANKEECLSILDMPSGYGRVLRYLKAEFPNAHITACELNRKAVDYCVSTFGVNGLYSDKDLKKIQMKNKFDLIWCGSLFTHLDQDLWPMFLDFFFNQLEEKGVLVFTTHGRYVAQRIFNKTCDYGISKEKLSVIFDGYNNNGFGYFNYINNEDYGISLSSFSWILNEISKIKGFRVVLFSEKGWDNHQDVIACIKETNSI